MTGLCPKFDEAEVLRAAARVGAVLGDHLAHDWAEVVDSCLDLAGGDRDAAYDLAELGVVYFASRTVWDSRRTRVGLIPPVDLQLLVACPACGALVGVACTDPPHGAEACPGRAVAYVESIAAEAD